MKSISLAKLAASTLILGTTMMGCTQAGLATGPAAASDSKLAKVGAKAASQAKAALGAKDYSGAIGFAEAAVAAAPRDAGYRAILGQAYLGAGRFASAGTSFADVLTLSPDDSRAALNLALAQIAQGKRAQANATLSDYRDHLAASDYGLALALAGDANAGVFALETAVRSGADAKTRQNLALAYAMAGKWMNARVMAAQDLTPADADARMAEWAGFVRPQGDSDQVASLLGVTPVQDGGQPTRLALGAGPETAVAIAQPIPAPAPVVVAAPEPVRAVAMAAPVAESVPVAQITPAAFETAPVPLIRAEAAPVKQAVIPARQIVVPVSKPVRTIPAAFAARRVESGKFVVQIGAYASVAAAKGAWSRAVGRYGLSSYEPANGSAKFAQATLVRLAFGGFRTRAEASQVCVRIQKAGGSCFVRGAAGDAPAQWVQRGMPKFASR